MIIWERLPCRVEYKGKTYRLKPSFDRVLEAVSVFGDERLLPDDRLRYALSLVVRGRCPLDPGLLEAALAALAWSEPESAEGGDRVLDFRQDGAYIYAAFRQAYGIDLFKERGRLHYAEFMALLRALPADTRLSEIIGIRCRPVPAATKHNAKEIQNLMKAKARYRINKSAEEQERSYQRSLEGFAQTLIGMIKGEKEGNMDG